MWYYVKLSYACGGVFVDKGFVMKTPPIFSWAAGKSFIQFRDFVLKKGGTINAINPIPS